MYKNFIKFTFTVTDNVPSLKILSYIKNRRFISSVSTKIRNVTGITKLKLPTSEKKFLDDIALNMRLNLQRLNVSYWLTEVTRLSSMLMTALLEKETLEYKPLASALRTFLTLSFG